MLQALYYILEIICQQEHHIPSQSESKQNIFRGSRERPFSFKTKEGKPVTFSPGFGEMFSSEKRRVVPEPNQKDHLPHGNFTSEDAQFQDFTVYSPFITIIYNPIEMAEADFFNKAVLILSLCAYSFEKLSKSKEK